jgi:hypothetical protein
VERRLTLLDISQRVNNDPLCTLDFDDLGCTIRGAAMVDEPRDPTLLGRIYDRVLVDPEQITTSYAAFDVFAFTHIRDLLADNFANVFDNHVIRRDVLHGVESPVVNCGPSKSYRLLPLFELVEAHDISIAAQDLFLIIEFLNEASIVDPVFTGR